MKLLTQFVDLYRNLGMHSIARLKEVYHADVCFIDPVGEHHGIKEIEGYFTNLLETANACEFNVTSIMSDNQLALARWQMNLRHPRLSGGRNIVVDGVSELLIADDRIKQQTDFYDMGTMIYEHIPVLGSAVRLVKRKMKHQG